MLTNSNKIIGHSESEKTIQEILELLGREDEELRLKFICLIQRVEDIQCGLDATWNSYLKALRKE